MMTSSNTNPIDQKAIEEFYDNEIDFTYELEEFILELELADMQPNSYFGLFVANPQFRKEQAVILETFKEEGYCIGRFMSDNRDIYIPAQPNTYNSFLEKDMIVTVGAINTPGLIYPWRSKFVNIANESRTFVIKVDIPDSAGLIIGPGGSYIENIKGNSKKNESARSPQITITNKDKFTVGVEIIGETNLIDIDYIKDQIMTIYYSNGISITIEE